MNKTKCFSNYKTTSHQETRKCSIVAIPFLSQAWRSECMARRCVIFLKYFIISEKSNRSEIFLLCFASKCIKIIETFDWKAWNHLNSELANDLLFPLMSISLTLSFHFPHEFSGKKFLDYTPWGGLSIKNQNDALYQSLTFSNWCFLLFQFNATIFSHLIILFQTLWNGRSAPRKLKNEKRQPSSLSKASFIGIKGQRPWNLPECDGFQAELAKVMSHSNCKLFHLLVDQLQSINSRTAFEEKADG